MFVDADYVVQHVQYEDLRANLLKPVERLERPTQPDRWIKWTSAEWVRSKRGNEGGL